MGNAPDIPREELNLTHMRTITALVGSMQRVQRSNGDRVGYDRLVLATGGTARCCSLPGSDKSNVYCLRSLADAEHLQRALDGFGNLVIVGGGYIGLEIAVVARTLGMATTVVEEASRILARTAHPKSKPSLRKNTVCAVSISAPASRCEPYKPEFGYRVYTEKAIEMTSQPSAKPTNGHRALVAASSEATPAPNADL